VVLGPQERASKMNKIDVGQLKEGHPHHTNHQCGPHRNISSR
jgi:hypothetical protein